MIETTTNKLTFLVGNDPVFAFPIPFFNKTDIHCYITNSDGILFELENGSQFSVEDREDYTEGALITLLDNHFSGSKLTISRVMIITQDISLPQYGKIPSPSLERQLDKTIMICQQLREMLSRVVLVPPGLDATWEDLMNLLTSAGQDAQEAAQRAQEILNLLEGMGIENLAPLDSPHFVGMPTAPTAGKGTNTDQLATTKFVQNEISDFLTRNKSSFVSSQWILDQSAGTYYHRIVTDAQDVSHVYKLESGGAMVMDDTVEIHIMDEGYIKLVAAAGFDGYILTLSERLPITYTYTPVSGSTGSVVSLTLTGVASNPGNETELYIPSSAEYDKNTYPVTTIGEYAFNGSKIVKISIGEGIATIGKAAFMGTTELRKVTFPSSLRTIGDSAFYTSSISEVSLPEGLETIGDSAFRFSSITSLHIPASVTEIGGAPAANCSYCTMLSTAAESVSFSSQDGVLFNKEKTILIQYPCANERTTYAVPEGVETLGKLCFSATNNLTQITLPDSLLSIESEAIFGSSITALEISKNLQSIGSSALSQLTALSAFTVATGNSAFSVLEGVLFNKEKTILIAYPAGNSRESYSVPSGVIELGEGSFRGVKYLKTVVLPDGLTKISSAAFYSSSLTGISLPASVTSIGENAFRPMPQLTAFTVATGNSSFSVLEGVLFNKEKTILIAYPAGNSRESYTIPPGVSEISAGAFYSSNISSVIFSEGLETIHSSAFQGMKNVSELILPSSLTTIGAEAFDSCSALEEVTFRNPGKWSMSNPFTRCSKLFTIYGYPGSTAEEFANRYNYLFKSLED